MNNNLKLQKRALLLFLAALTPSLSATQASVDSQEEMEEIEDDLDEQESEDSESISPSSKLKKGLLATGSVLTVAALAALGLTYRRSTAVSFDKNKAKTLDGAKAIFEENAKSGGILQLKDGVYSPVAAPATQPKFYEKASANEKGAYLIKSVTAIFLKNVAAETAKVSALLNVVKNSISSIEFQLAADKLQEAFNALSSLVKNFMDFDKMVVLSEADFNNHSQSLNKLVEKGLFFEKELGTKAQLFLTYTKSSELEAHAFSTLNASHPVPVKPGSVWLNFTKDKFEIHASTWAGSGKVTEEQTAAFVNFKALVKAEEDEAKALALIKKHVYASSKGYHYFSKEEVKLENRNWYQVAWHDRNITDAEAKQIWAQCRK